MSNQYPPPYSAAPQKKPGSKKWLFLGCGGCLGLVVLGGLAFMAFFYFVLGAVKKTPVYADAVKIAKESTVLQEEIGTPMTETLFSGGKVNESGDTGDAALLITLQGPKGVAAVTAQAAKANGAWNYSSLQAVVQKTGDSTAQQKTIDLKSGTVLPSTESAPAPEPTPAPSTPEPAPAQ